MFERLGIAARLIVPFVVISLLTTVLVGAVCFWKMSNDLVKSLDDQSAMLTESLANELSDPFAFGEYDHMEQIITAALNKYPFMDYAAVMSPDGRVIVTTDPNRKNTVMGKRSFDREALRITALTRRNTPYDVRLFECVTPITTSNRQLAIMRVGFSRESVDRSIKEAELVIYGCGLAGIILGVVTYWGLTNNSIVRPIGAVANSAERISSGDLPQPLEITRGDEVGKLIGSMNAMIRDLNDMATVADAIASGDLDVKIAPKSARDVFGNAFQKMVASLKSHTRELEASEYRFRSLCQTSPVGIFETDRDGRVTYANACWEKMSGLALREMKGKPWYDTVHQVDKKEAIERFGDILTAPDETHSQELRIVRRTGEVSWVHCLSTKLEREKGIIDGFVCTIEDITNRKVSDMAQYQIPAILGEANSTDEAAPRILELACHILDLEAAILWKVDDAEQVLRSVHAWFSPSTGGLAMQEAARDYTCTQSDGLAGLVWTLGRPMWLDRDHLRRNISSTGSLIEANPEVRSAFACAVQANHKTIGVMEFYSRAKNELHAELLDAYSSVAMQLGHFTERLEAETAAKQLAAVVESSEDAIISATLGNKIISWNLGAQKLFGYTAGEVIEKSIDILLVEKDNKHFREMIGDLLNDVKVETYDTMMVKEDGTTIDVALTISPVHAGSNKIVGISVIARDITHKKAVEERMREFYAIVSHELRTPLTSIRGALGLISDGVISADSAEGLELIDLAKSSAVRLVRLINDILDLRKIEAGSLELQLQTIDAHELANNSVDAMRGMAQEREVNLVAQIRSEGKILADMDRATQVLTNLLSNAIKYSNPKSDVRLIVEDCDDPEALRFSIIDRGSGIPIEQQHKLFGKFQQLDSSDTRTKEGTGLGLAISKAIVEEHGGRIGVQSTVGVGSTFWVEFKLSSVARQERPE